MNLAWTRRFQKDMERLPEALQRLALSKLDVLASNLSHPSLRVKRVRSFPGRYEGSINMQYRFTFEIEDDTIMLLRIGPHKILDEA